MESITRYSGFGIVISLVIFLTNLTQLPFIVEHGYSSNLNLIPWGGLCLFIPFLSGILFTYRFLRFAGIVLVFFSGQCLFEFISGNNYISSVLSYPLYSSMFIVVMGYLFSPKINKRDLKLVFLCYVLSSAIVGISIFFTYLKGGIDWDAHQYIYGSKNSISQILFTSIIILLLYFRNTGKSVYAILKWVIVAFLTYVILALKSRATIICYIVLLYVLLYKSSLKIQTKIIIVGISLFLLIIGFAVFNDYISFMWNNILLANNNAQDIDAVSSGRVDIIEEAFQLWNGNELLGIGSKYIECFYIASIVQYGIFLGLLLIFIAVTPLLMSVPEIFGTEFNIAYKTIALTYCIDGFFECLAPFGPGVKCYILWFLFGMILSYINSNNNA